MKITLNNRPTEIETGKILSISELLEKQKFTFKMLVIKVNNKLVKKLDYSSTFIQEGDKVDVIHLISGG